MSALVDVPAPLQAQYRAWSLVSDRILTVEYCDYYAELSHKIPQYRWKS